MQSSKTEEKRRGEKQTSPRLLCWANGEADHSRFTHMNSTRFTFVERRATTQEMMWFENIFTIVLIPCKGTEKNEKRNTCVNMTKPGGRLFDLLNYLLVVFSFFRNPSSSNFLSVSCFDCHGVFVFISLSRSLLFGENIRNGFKFCGRMNLIYELRSCHFDKLCSDYVFYRLFFPFVVVVAFLTLKWLIALFFFLLPLVVGSSRCFRFWISNEFENWICFAYFEHTHTHAHTGRHFELMIETPKYQSHRHISCSLCVCQSRVASHLCGSHSPYHSSREF